MERYFKKAEFPVKSVFLFTFFFIDGKIILNNNNNKVYWQKIDKKYKWQQKRGKHKFKLRSIQKRQAPR